MEPTTSLQLLSLVKEPGELEVSLKRIPVAAPKPDEVVVRIEGTPLNPSDLGLLFGAADMGTARQSGTQDQPVVIATIPPERMPAMASRLGQPMPVGNEGAGTVVSAGDSEEAQALLGKKVAVLGGAMYTQYRTVKAKACLVLPPGATAAEGASCFVNPLTSQGMVETMRMEGHKALVHTAAASNLGQMLNRICIADKVGLVNIVRSQAQADLLRGQGAAHVCNSGAPTFMEDLTEALVATGATIAFDAVGGGPLAGQILGCMETAANRTAKEYSRYGSAVHKQVYIYGNLETAPSTLTRNYGMAWGVGGWYLTPFLQRIGREGQQKLRARVVAELKTTFASHYAKEISLAEALTLAGIAAYNKRSTGEKFLINPNKGPALLT
jgi:NADPH2:quinone reductase